MAVGLSAEQRVLCDMLAASLNGGALSEQGRLAAEKADLKSVLDVAERHKVLPFLYDVLAESGLTEKVDWARVESICRKTVCQSYRLLFLTRFLAQVLEREQIPVVVLKGCSIAADYPVPELRKSGDVDLLVRGQDMPRAITAMEKAGYFISEKQDANHHIVFCSEEKIDVELHVMLVEPFDDERINDRMRELAGEFADRVARRECMGIEFPVLEDSSQAFQLLLHMLQHFLRAGFGLKLLCDWTVFWNGRSREKAWHEFEQLARENGTYEFARVVTECCVRYLGLRGEYSEEGQDAELVEQFLCDVFVAEEFGRSSGERMVALKGTGLLAYVREFHHQMKINHPKASRCVLLWPALWVVTLVVFLYNNHKLKRGSVSSILRSADQRGRLVRQMRLWEKRDGKDAGD